MSDHAAGVGEPIFEVVIPIGRQRQPGLEPSAAINGLAHKRVGFVWDQLFSGDLIFDTIADELGRSFEGLEFIGYEQFGDIHGADEKRVLEALPELLQQHRVNGLVVGIGA